MYLRLDAVARTRSCCAAGPALCDAVGNARPAVKDDGSLGSPVAPINNKGLGFRVQGLGFPTIRF